MPTIQELYKESGLTQAELSRRARLSQNTVRKAERGEEVSPATALAIAEAFSQVLGRRITVGSITDLNVSR
jgi:transcriptional regulator with XRE-family HTH domain